MGEEGVRRCGAITVAILHIIVTIQIKILLITRTRNGAPKTERIEIACSYKY